MSASEHSARDKAVSITNSTPSENRIVLKVRKDSVRWVGSDEAYELWFQEKDWHFKQSPDKTESGFCIIEVRHEHHTQKFTLECAVDPGGAHEHRYDIRKATARTVAGPPNGPSVVGEG